MAKRLSKALRGKRRWVGVIIPAGIKSKQEAIKTLEMFLATYDLIQKPRLVEFNLNHLSDGRSVGIIEVKLVDYPKIRNILEGELIDDGNQFTSYTSSGKIRLVRERIFSLE
ncbi:MAG TPA: hypothetical protein HA354_04330 [Candidatus Poseidoniaceae archaeon]|nr:hypothetical protein [Euryarchaeota archaeon]DAC58080.1 MAG TPA: hypothetical protein D7I07_04295 [Candidatus Poseidoniales archaeon]HII37704.1 hypothetical protein [Candidatus Poseidoniaceae archaeon]|tara:strand:+ start:581 stop:916 length:336 start_codon:yes stop_codon:yes gene_type:complete